MKNFQYKRVLALGCLASVAFMGLFFTACGDDVTKVIEGNVSTVESLDDVKCDEDAAGSMVYDEETGKMYVCSDEKWKSVVGEIATRCETKSLKDSSGIVILCDGDSIGVVLNGDDGSKGKQGAKGETGAPGSSGSKGEAGESCSIKETSQDSVWIACGKDVAAIPLPDASAKLDTNLLKKYHPSVSVYVPHGSYYNTDFY